MSSSLIPRSDASFSIKVECHPGHRGEAEPSAFTLGERRFPVVEILDRWPAYERRYFKVRLEDGRRMVLRHDRETDEWVLAALVREEPGASAGTRLH